MSVLLITPNRGSRSGSLLARAMGAKKLSGARLAKAEVSAEDWVVNWGNSNPPQNVLVGKVLNKPEAIKTAVNKLEAFVAMQNAGVRVPSFTQSEAIAQAWVQDGHKVVARHTLTGSGGDGIQILSSVDDFPCQAPLYALYIPKKSEFRFHISHNSVFDIQRKMRRRDVPDDKVNWQVRNHNNGFIFGRGGEPIEPEVYEQVSTNAKQAVRALGLDFGAVDVIWNEKTSRAYVLEVNTAPGLEGTTLSNYADVFLSFFYKQRSQGVLNPRPAGKRNFGPLEQIILRRQVEVQVEEF